MKYICIHGHFYQPPRENPWLEYIEEQKSANPYNNWNERIAAECYTRNSQSRILDNEGKLIKIMNNYKYISFNFGPTLLSWMEKHTNSTYEKILLADQESTQIYNGHGSAIAQVYNHIIMPLASRLDKEIQVKWGISDFKYRFGRYPEGMWLSETAVDTETLEVLANYNIKFTILAYNQAKEFKKLTSTVWNDVSDGSIDTRRPYICKLPSGNTITLFFYNGELSRAIAFEKLLNDGIVFGKKLINSFDKESKEFQLVNIATDGETYGHHHRFGEMALSSCIEFIKNNKDCFICNYAYFLSLSPPTYEVRIKENSSWSCIHGVERWKSNCGCNNGSIQNSNQEWRKPLRDAVNWLGNEIDELYFNEAPKYLIDPKLAILNYIKLFQSYRNDQKKEKFLLNNQLHSLNKAERFKVFVLLDLMRNKQLISTSCAWFFDDISGLEPVQILFYVERCCQLYIQLKGSDFDNLKESLLYILKDAKSNFTELGNGEDIYKRYIIPGIINFDKTVMHYSISLLVEKKENLLIKEYGIYKIKTKDYKTFSSGQNRLIYGECFVESAISENIREYFFITIYLGQTHFIGKLFKDITKVPNKTEINELIQNFEKMELVPAIFNLEKLENGTRYGFSSLSNVYRNDIFKILLKDEFKDITKYFENIINKNLFILSIMNGMQKEPPLLIKRNFNNNFNYKLLENLEKMEQNFSELEKIDSDIKKWSIEIYSSDINIAAQNKVKYLMDEIKKNLNNTEIYLTAFRTIEIILSWKIGVDLIESENTFFEIFQLLNKEILDVNFIMTQPMIENIKIFINIGRLLNVSQNLYLNSKLMLYI